MINIQNQNLSLVIRVLAWGSVVVLLALTYVFLMAGGALNRDAHHETEFHERFDTVPAGENLPKGDLDNHEDRTNRSTQ